MKKFNEIASRTGLSEREAARLTRFGFLGLLALCLTSLSACFKAQKAAPSPAEAKPATLQDLADSVKDAAPAPAPAANESTAAPRGGKPAQDKNCGPYPGYPCGTRYYTVSRADIHGAA